MPVRDRNKRLRLFPDLRRRNADTDRPADRAMVYGVA